MGTICPTANGINSLVRTLQVEFSIKVKWGKTRKLRMRLRLRCSKARSIYLAMPCICSSRLQVKVKTYNEGTRLATVEVRQLDQPRDRVLCKEIIIPQSQTLSMPTQGSNTRRTSTQQLPETDLSTARLQCPRRLWRSGHDSDSFAPGGSPRGKAYYT